MLSKLRPNSLSSGVTTAFRRMLWESIWFTACCSDWQYSTVFSFRFLTPLIFYNDQTPGSFVCPYEKPAEVDPLGSHHLCISTAICPPLCWNTICAAANNYYWQSECRVNPELVLKTTVYTPSSPFICQAAVFYINTLQPLTSYPLKL